MLKNQVLARIVAGVCPIVGAKQWPRVWGRLLVRPSDRHSCMANDEKVLELRRRYDSYSDSALVHEREKWIEGTAERIAAEQLLHERAEARESNRHEEALYQSRSANRFAKAAIWIALLSILLTCAQLIQQRLLP